MLNRTIGDAVSIPADRGIKPQAASAPPIAAAAAMPLTRIHDHVRD